MLTLQQIGKRCGTDKAATSHAFNGRTYLHVLEPYVKKFRHCPINLLEIGVKSGQSLKMWAQYFPKAKVYGLDIDPACSKYSGGRVQVVVGSQTDDKVLSSLAGAKSVHGVGFHVVVDDGSHVVKHIIKSFEYLFRFVVPGGIYVIEDLACSYKALTTKHNVRKNWPA